MGFTVVRAVFLALAFLALADASGLVNAQAPRVATSSAPYSPLRGLTVPAGLWDKPNEACITKCEVFVDKDCFRELSRKEPHADPASLQERCEGKYSLCLYDCMCDTCAENQIDIKQR